MAGTAMGVLILGLIQTLITFKGDLNSWWTRIAVGMLVFVFMHRIKRRETRSPPTKNPHEP